METTRVIINVRGTHGSGKTELVRRVMKRHLHCEPMYIEGRNAPIGYMCQRSESSRRRLLVMGSYEAVSGGCDTISKVDLMYETIRRYAKMKKVDVLFEGILAQHSTPNIARLLKKHDVNVVVLKVPVKKSIRGVKARRKARGDTRPLNTENIIKEARYTARAAHRLRDAGARVFFCKTRKRALRRTLALLDLT